MRFMMAENVCANHHIIELMVNAQNVLLIISTPAKYKTAFLFAKRTNNIHIYTRNVSAKRDIFKLIRLVVLVQKEPLTTLN